MKTTLALRPLLAAYPIACAISASSRPRFGGSLRQKIATVLALPLHADGDSRCCSGIFAPMGMNADFESFLGSQRSVSRGSAKIALVAPPYNLRTTQS